MFLNLANSKLEYNSHGPVQWFSSDFSTKNFFVWTIFMKYFTSPNNSLLSSLLKKSSWIFVNHILDFTRLSSYDCSRLSFFHFVSCAVHSFRERHFAVCLQIIIAWSVHRTVEAHESNRCSLLASSFFEVVPRFALDRRETFFVFRSNAFSPEEPTAAVTAKVVVSEHFVVSLRTPRLKGLPRIWPEINGTSWEWSSIKPSIGVNYIYLRMRSE